MTAITGPDVGTSVHDMVVRRTALYSLSPQQQLHMTSSTPPSNLINFSSSHSSNKNKSTQNLQIGVGGGGQSNSTLANNTSGNSMVIGCWQKPYHHSNKSKQIRSSNSTDCLDDPRISQTNKSQNDKDYDKSLAVPKTDDELLDIITDASNNFAYLC